MFYLIPVHTFGVPPALKYPDKQAVHIFPSVHVIQKDIVDEHARKWEFIFLKLILNK